MKDVSADPERGQILPVIWSGEWIAHELTEFKLFADIRNGPSKFHLLIAMCREGDSTESTGTTLPWEGDLTPPNKSWGEEKKNEHFKFVEHVLAYEHGDWYGHLTDKTITIVLRREKEKIASFEFSIEEKDLSYWMKKRSKSGPRIKDLRKGVKELLKR
jgi:hypothetical protein